MRFWMGLVVGLVACAAVKAQPEVIVPQPEGSNVVRTTDPRPQPSLPHGSLYVGLRSLTGEERVLACEGSLEYREEQLGSSMGRDYGPSALFAVFRTAAGEERVFVCSGELYHAEEGGRDLLRLSR
jgi:hypothetical protein